MNYLNYANHVITAPDTYQRRFDLDLPQEPENEWVKQGKRVALLALPFVGLYRPIGSAISVTMGSVRAVTHLNEAVSQEKDWKKCSLAMAQTALAVTSVAATVFSFAIGLYVITAVDGAQGVFRTCVYLKEGEFQKCGEEALQAIASGFYLCFMATGVLEAILISTLFQAVISLYQARQDYAKGNYLEAFAKLAMGGIRFHQAHQYKQMIDRRNFMQKVEKYQKLIERAIKGRNVRHLIENPLANLKDQVEENKAILINGDEEVDFGSNFHGHGKGLIKGSNLTFRTKVVDGKEMLELDFKINHAFREKIGQTVVDFSKLKKDEVSEILAMTGSHVKGIHIEKEPLMVGDTEVGTSIMDRIMGENGKEPILTLEGLGSISICTDEFKPNLYDRIVVQMDADKTIYDLHEMISFMDLDEALLVSSLEDMERLKIGHLFRNYFPGEATQFERTEEFFSLSIEDLKRKIVETSPEMEGLFTSSLDKMEAREIVPGRVRYTIPEIADKVRELGGFALTTAITGAYSDEEMFERVATMLEMGLISAETRLSNNIDAGGLTKGREFMSGGADSVYLQMLTQQNCKDQMSFDVLYHSKVRMLVSLDALETGSYQYFEDSFGNRQMVEDDWHGIEDYKSRSNILDFTKKLEEAHVERSLWWAGWIGGQWVEKERDWWKYDRNEVMLKERLDPKFFQAIVVADEETQTNLLAYLRDRSLVAQDSLGNETIHNIAVDRFIRVATNISEDLGVV